jgi:hypothetical protein
LEMPEVGNDDKNIEEIDVLEDLVHEFTLAVERYSPKPMNLC